MFNLLIAIVVAIGIAFILIYFISAHDHKMNQKNKSAADADGYTEAPYNFKQFSEICEKLCSALNLSIDETKYLQDNEIIFRATHKDPIIDVQFLVVALYLAPDKTASTNKIMEISDQIISERLSKAIIITSGKIDMSVKLRPELAPMTLIDFDKLNLLMEEHGISASQT